MRLGGVLYLAIIALVLFGEAIVRQAARPRLCDRAALIRAQLPRARRADEPVPLFPRALGTLLMLAGVSYLLNSGALLLAPARAAALFPWVLAPAFVGELALAVWMLAKGIDLRRWPPAAEPPGR